MTTRTYELLTADKATFIFVDHPTGVRGATLVGQISSSYRK